jgi:hypothetical protein
MAGPSTPPATAILFESRHALPPGLDIELSIAWPARIGDVVPLKLCVSGQTVRGQDQCTAVKILRHTFRTRGARESDASAVTLPRIRKGGSTAGATPSGSHSNPVTAGPIASKRLSLNRTQTVRNPAVQWPRDERTEFLAPACAADSERRPEVESLPVRDRQPDRLLESPAWSRITPRDETGSRALGMLSAGSLMAEYRIVGELGSGGMGEVYRATDTRLEREVALKVLAAGFAHDSAWISRFQHEARVLASLNHPHIAAIYGLEESAGLRAIAMELVEGPTLAERMARGRIPIQESLAIAQQIAEALEYAHEKGIVHRDLKPPNVKLRPDGVVKVLDFGLAKAADSDEMPAVTAAGIILGTPAYMPPEQAGGLPVDRRADIWAFGVVLFEMLAGRQVYARKTTLETLAAVARDEPKWDELPKETPAVIVRLLRRCLDRNPKSRLRDIGEARIAIEAALGGETSLREGAPAPGGIRRPCLAWGVAAVLAVGLATVSFLHFGERPLNPAGPVPVQVSPPENRMLANFRPVDQWPQARPGLVAQALLPAAPALMPALGALPPSSMLASPQPRNYSTNPPQ